MTPQSPALLLNNWAFHKMLRDGVEVEYPRLDGTIAGVRARLLSDDPSENDWLAVNQFTVVEGTYNRRPDVVVFLNGLLGYATILSGGSGIVKEREARQEQSPTSTV